MKNVTTVKGIHFETGKPVRIDISGGIITDISKTNAAGLLSDKYYIAPGLIDNQINGYIGVDFSAPELTLAEMLKAVKAIQNDGVTTFHPTILTGSHENLLKIFRNHASFIKNDEVSESVPGFHLEGPYLSPVRGFFGCHPEQWLRKPSWSEFSEYQDAAEGKIRIVTLSPELDGAIEFIKKCVANNIMVSIGHSNASADQINKAVDSGAWLSTHLGNGCANLIDRHRNPIWPQLANDLITPSIIGDGHHLLPEELKVFYKVKGPDNLILISDVTHLIGMAPGKYIYMGNEVVFTEDGLIKNPVLDVLAGASFPVRTGIGNMIRSAGCNLGQAVNLATKNVSAACRLGDRGTLAPGKRADLILFEMKDNNLIVRQTWVKGRKIYDSSHL
jgi:N-acetylglucosamine-6-phosphate deacetylase